MSLRLIHLFFITMAVILSFLTGWLCYVQAAAGSDGMMEVSIICNLSGVALLAYGIWFVAKKFQTLA